MATRVHDVGRLQVVVEGGVADVGPLLEDDALLVLLLLARAASQGGRIQEAGGAGLQVLQQVLVAMLGLLEDLAADEDLVGEAVVLVHWLPLVGASSVCYGYTRGTHVCSELRVAEDARDSRHVRLGAHPELIQGLQLVPVGL